ncbi:MAG: DUF3352 domain-containing protein [Desulforhopalus sp.]
MKINVVVSFLSVLLVVAYLFVMQIEVDEIGSDMASFIPDTALLYFEQQDGSKALSRFVASPLGKHFEALDLVATGEKIGISTTALASINEFISGYKRLKDNTLFHELLGKRFALAVLTPLQNQNYSTVKDFFKLNAVVVVHPHHNTGLLEFLAENYSRYSEGVSITTTQYGNHHIKRIKKGNLNVSLVGIEGHFLVSENERQLRKCIDTYDDERVAVADNKIFLAVRENFDAPDRYLYLPVDRLRGFLTDFVKNNIMAGRELFLKELHTTLGFTGFGFGAWSREESVVDKVIVTYDTEEVNSHVKNYLDVVPSKSSMLSLSTPEPMVYYWSNTLDFNNFLLYASDEKSSDPRLIRFIETIEETAGKSAEEILSLLGGEVSLVLEPGAKENYFPFPLGVVFVKVDRVEDLEKLFQLLLEKYDVPVNSTTYGEARYVYWKLSPQDGLQPLYGFWQDMVFFGNSSKLLRKIIDVNGDDNFFPDGPEVKGIDPGIKGKNNSISYFNNLELIKVVQGTLGMIGTLVGIEDRRAAMNIRILRDEVISPILEGLTMYDRSITRSYFTRDMVIVDSITHINLK